ncbi:FAD-dependent oxidoreductase [Mesorhizobium sp. Root157]|uniref:TIGR03364 family FAD-dependent oxidoreductase n=1 Tax=Mesorhizobium sp. Root157 TaxID=1736477 RepID=UPI0007012B82|nr:TIGR03364 family FAD-dependent oxidoreductase [Mesorhizobium sp. Root157]KQZ79086.1 FAD-dependent oxidoreductase [Mesorhizobium sp. Root157]
MTFDLAVVGAGIVGLAHALAAARRGLRVVVIDRDAQANGASIRNFGLVVVSGQEPGASLRRAQRSREIWLEMAPQAGIGVIQQGMLVAAQRPEALSLLEAFQQTGQGQMCQLLTRNQVASHQPELDASKIAGGLHSPFELRIESREAIPRLASFLAGHHHVEFRRGVTVLSVAPPAVETSHGTIKADKVAVCPGDDFATLYPDRIGRHGVRRCKLQMLRLANPGFALRSALVSDLSLIRYEGYAQLPEAAILRGRLRNECPRTIENGVHLIVVQSADGSLVVGDSHHYAETPDPFASEEVDGLILDELATLLGGALPAVQARWTGTYASASDKPAFTDAPQDNVRLVMITSGTGASTGFAIGEETIADLFG